MNNILKKLKLVDSFTFELPIDKQNFIEKLGKKIEPSDLGFLSGLFEVFSSNKSRYKGKLDRRGFKIRQRKDFSRYKKQKTIAEGTLREVGDVLKIEVNVNGVDKKMVFILITLLIIYTFFLSGYKSFEQDSPVLFFVLLHAIIVLGVFYFKTRKSVKDIKEDLGKCFSKIVKKKVIPISK